MIYPLNFWFIFQNKSQFFSRKIGGKKRPSTGKRKYEDKAGYFQIFPDIASYSEVSGEKKTALKLGLYVI